ncbi:hemerythrin-like metal-binding protein [Paucimonas lemoignei]|uniref:Hemerythrin-like metal-binding protein n=1 Tax=Paucimonas lemoignei TaxID=29443 RepID=A0A4R3HZ70_PAULE|nr:hemerythrin domain-containing protein [Paucimonas lemoignei]TCS38538.1 hemerythrin-like metal-binding protein [Paucimonas lemoignei]
MQAYGIPSAGALDEAKIKQLYPQLFSELDAMTVASDAQFSLRYPKFVDELERDFANEEQWMADMDVRVVQEHRAEHAQLLRLLHHAQSRVMAGDCNLGRKILPLLPPWFASHISEMDTIWAQAACRKQA